MDKESQQQTGYFIWQDTARLLAAKFDVMLVVEGRNSANTSKLGHSGTRPEGVLIFLVAVIAKIL